MKKLLFLSFIITLISCQEKFEPNKFNGDWISMDKNGGFSSLPTIKFKKDSIYFIDAYTYTTKAKFKITRNKINCFFKKDTLINKFKFSSKDSTITIGKNKYSFWKEYSDFNELTNYELIGIKSKQNIISDSLLSGISSGFHLFKSKENILKLKLNDRVTQDLNTLLPFLVVGCNPNNIYPVTKIFLGKRIKLNELLKSYYRLSSVNINKIILITDFNLNENSYSIFYDRISFWENQLEMFYRENNIPPIPPSLENYRKVYIKKNTPKILVINSFKELKILDNINTNNNYLISINPEMEIETYLKLKEKLIEIKKKEKIRIKTEFILPELN